MSDPARFAALQRDRFRGLGRVTPSIATAWPRAWAPDRRYLVFLAAVGDVAVVRAAAARAVTPIAGAGAPPLDPRRLHVTIQAVGYLDELPPGSVDALRGEAGTALADVGPIELGIAGAGSFADAAVLWLEPWDGLIAIRDRLLDGVTSLTMSKAERALAPADGGFAPHVSIAYYDEAVATGPIADALEAVGTDGGRFTIGAVQLVSVPPPAEGQIAWDVLGTFPLSRRLDDR